MKHTLTDLLLNSPAPPRVARGLVLASACIAACLVAESRGADVTQTAQPRISVLIVDGQNNHEWKTTTKVLREALESAGRFMVDVATSPPAGASMEGFEPAFHSHRAVVLKYNGDAWPAGA